MRQLYKDTRGIEICKQDKSTIEELRHGQSDQSLTYGEVVSTSFETILGEALHMLGRDTDVVFYDLGSGTGKACITAVLCCPGVTRSVGLELVPSLHNAAAQCLSHLLSAMHAASQVAAASKKKSLPRLEDKLAPRSALKKGSAGQVLPPDELVAIVLAELRRSAEVWADAATLGCVESRLANAVCLALGQKDFKASFRASSNGTFHRFLSAQPAFELYDVEGVGWVKQREEEGGTAAEAEAEELSPPELQEAGPPVVFDCADATVAPAPAESDPLLQTLSRANVMPAFATLGEVVLEVADIFEREPLWHVEADVAYCASLLFTDAMMQRLAEQALLMRPGSVLLSLKALPLVEEQGETLRLVSESFYQFSWQKARVYVYQVNR